MAVKIPMWLVHVAFVVLVATHLVWAWHLWQSRKLKSKEGLMLLVNVVSVVILFLAHWATMMK